MEQYLRVKRVLLKDFGKHAKQVSERLKAASLMEARRWGRQVRYLPSAKTSKETVAREIATRDGISEGLICVLTCVEVCPSFDIYRNREMKILELQPRTRKCLHYYHYWMHPELGFMHARIQTWFPFTIQVCLNGREWLAQSLSREGMGYQRKGNCFTWLADVERAQELMDAQLRTNWPHLLDSIARALNSAHEEIFRGFSLSYYWTVHQSEWATDVMFRRAPELAALYPRLIRHGISTFGSGDVMRFLGRKVPPSGKVHGNFAGEVISDIRERPEGLRLRHRVNRNWLKMYDKQGSILRVETVINCPRDFQSYRPKEGGPRDEKKWRIMRRGVADIHRRAQVSQAANERYLDMLAEVDMDAPLGKIMDRLCLHVIWKGKRHRGLNPWGQDASLLAVIARGEYSVNGFRNRDLRERLFGPAKNDQEKKRQSGKVTRMLRLLRAHGLIRKIAHTFRYHLTAKGRSILIALSAAKNASPRKLTELAA
jgi:hypothetical protein